jgi:hypothetical protein
MKEDYSREIFDGKDKFDDDELIKLNKKLKQETFNETQFNEAKYFHNNGKIRANHELYEGHIVKPLVGFLNSYGGFGNLYLGIDTGGSGKSKFLEIQPINKKLIRGDEDLRKLIFDKLGTLPFSHEKPRVEIKKIKFKSGNVFIVFIERCNNYSVYYSRITDYIYKRNLDETKRLDLLESLQLVETKKNPRLSIELTPKSYNPVAVGTIKKKRVTEITYGVRILNEGMEPSFFTTGIVLIKFKENNKTRIKAVPGGWRLIEERALFNKYQFDLGMGAQARPIYPTIGTFLGDLVITTEDFFDLDLEIKILDKKGIASQSFSLTERLDKETSSLLISPLDNRVDYSPYT